MISDQDKYIEDKAKELIEKLESWEPSLIGQDEIRHTVIKNFILSIVKEIKAMPNQNDKRLNELVEEMRLKIFDYFRHTWPRLPQKKMIQDFILSIVQKIKLVVDKDWLPTAENVNALPDPIRRYIHDLETNCDPPSMVRENIILKETCKALEIKLSEAESIRAKERVFVEHIENHLRDMGIEGKVICKICGKDIDMIAKEAGVEVKNER